MKGEQKAFKVERTKRQGRSDSDRERKRSDEQKSEDAVVSLQLTTPRSSTAEWSSDQSRPQLDMLVIRPGHPRAHWVKYSPLTARRAVVPQGDPEYGSM